MKSPVKRGTTIFLIIASIAIWGTVGLKVFQGLETTDGGEKIVQNRIDSKQENKRLKLTEEAFLKRIQMVRDPFLPDKPKRIKVKKRPVKLPAPVVFSQIAYIGYLEGVNGLMAIVEGKNEQTRFCTVGDTLFEVKVISIQPEKIGIQKGKKTDWVSLRKS